MRRQQKKTSFDFSAFSRRPRPKKTFYLEYDEEVADLWEEMRGNGIEPPEEIIVDDEIHHFDTKRGTNSGFYGLHEREFGFYGIYGDYSTGREPECYTSFKPRDLTDAQIAQFNTDMSVLMEKWDRQRGMIGEQGILESHTPKLYTFYTNDVQMPRKDWPGVWSVVTDEGKPEYMYRGYPNIRE